MDTGKFKDWVRQEYAARRGDAQGVCDGLLLALQWVEVQESEKAESSAKEAAYRSDMAAVRMSGKRALDAGLKLEPGMLMISAIPGALGARMGCRLDDAPSEHGGYDWPHDVGLMVPDLRVDATQRLAMEQVANRVFAQDWEVWSKASEPNLHVVSVDGWIAGSGATQHEAVASAVESILGRVRGEEEE